MTGTQTLDRPDKRQRVAGEVSDAPGGRFTAHKDPVIIPGWTAFHPAIELETSAAGWVAAMTRAAVYSRRQNTLRISAGQALPSFCGRKRASKTSRAGRGRNEAKHLTLTPEGAKGRWTMLAGHSRCRRRHRLHRACQLVGRGRLRMMSGKRHAVDKQMLDGVEGEYTARHVGALAAGRGAARWRRPPWNKGYPPDARSSFSSVSRLAEFPGGR